MSDVDTPRTIYAPLLPRMIPWGGDLRQSALVDVGATAELDVRRICTAAREQLVRAIDSGYRPTKLVLGRAYYVVRDGDTEQQGLLNLGHLPLPGLGDLDIVLNPYFDGIALA